MVKNDTCWVLKGSWGLTEQGYRKETQRRKSLEESTYSIIQKTERMQVIFDLRHVLSLPLILMLSASFLQLQYKVRLLNSLTLVETTEFLKVQPEKLWAASDGQKKLSWYSSICQPGNLATAPLTVSDLIFMKNAFLQI